MTGRGGRRPIPFLAGGLALAALACNTSLFAPTRTPVPTPTPTSAAAAYAGWPVVLRDTFFEPRNSWELAEASDDRWAKGRLAVEAGKYRFDLTANDGFIWWSRGRLDALTTDFYAAVDGRQVSGTADADYGLIFRFAAGNFYYFQISDSSASFAVYRYQAETWTAMLEWTASPAIRPGEANQLAVAGEGPDFTLLINGEAVGAFTDDALPEGGTGVAVQIYTAGEAAVFEFDNFEWRAPRASLVTTTPEP
ncbi:MAG: hypothetical protein JNK29_07340 [Anaerolineales bacterium]|nr:hypothetical protein [Anaerolineales bacterium]